MAVFEDELVYGMIAYDAMRIMPDKIRNIGDVDRWSADLNVRSKLGAHYKRRTKPAMTKLNPILEEGLLQPMMMEKNVESHSFDILKREGGLINNVVASCRGCKTATSAFMHNTGGMEPMLLNMGVFTHRLIDVWNPFNLVPTDPEMDKIASMFITDVKAHILDMPFMWKLMGNQKGYDEICQNSPYMDPTSTIIEAERRLVSMGDPIAVGYQAGNGYPVVKGQIHAWYDATVNALGRAWLFCST